MPQHPKKPKKPKKPKHLKKPKLKRKRRLKTGLKPQKPFHKPKRGPRSGSIPRTCRKWLDDERLLDCWISQNPRIANAIVWENADGAVAWPEWSNPMKAALRSAWMAARTWQANGMTHFAGPAWLDPPPNQDASIVAGPFHPTVLDGPTQAWPWYLATVAQSLAAEIEGWVPWSLRGFGDEALEHLLSGPQIFVRDRDDGGSFDSHHPGRYVIAGSSSMEKCTPSHPTYTYRFLVEHDLVGTTPIDTVARVLEWCRSNLHHFIGAFSPQTAEDHWQYRGLPPARRILEGTTRAGESQPKHWTAGCWGTSAFLRSLLRSVNLPVILRWRCGHTMPYFAGAGRSLSHGDDPYSALAKADYPAKQLLVDANTFEAWFPFDPGASDAQQAADEATSCAHIGRRVVDLAVWNLGDALVFKYCQDQASGASHATGKVFEVFEPHGYTVAQLEATQLWQRLAAEAQAHGAC